MICGRIYVNEDELAEGELPVSSTEVAATLNPPAVSANESLFSQAYSCVRSLERALKLCLV